MWLDKTLKSDSPSPVKHCSDKASSVVPLSKELSGHDGKDEPERVKVCGTCQGTLTRFKGYVWIEDFSRAIDSLCKCRRGEFEIVLTLPAVDALGVIVRLANSKVYCYRERCWVRLLEPACVFYNQREVKAQ